MWTRLSMTSLARYSHETRCHQRLFTAYDPSASFVAIAEAFLHTDAMPALR
jgi:hypothetical protein